MKRIERLLAISDRLRLARSATVPASTLADELGVSRRTIERDLVALRAAGLPVYGVLGRGGGSGSIARRGTSMVALSDAELVSLVVAAHVNGGGPYATASQGAIVKLLESLDPARRVAIEDLRHRFRIAANPTGTRAQRIRSVIEDAVQEQCVVRIAYTDRNGEVTDRHVEPVGFYFADGNWALVAWCRLRNDGRQFHLSRINSARMTRQRFPTRDLDATLGWVPEPGTAP